MTDYRLQPSKSAKGVGKTYLESSFAEITVQLKSFSPSFPLSHSPTPPLSTPSQIGKCSQDATSFCVKLGTVYPLGNGGFGGWLLASLSCVTVKAATTP
jgi:hypothetical protein